MAGIKGKSGRKPLRDEIVQNEVINLSWVTIHRALNSRNISQEEKQRIALEIVKRTCPQKVDLGGTGDTYITTIVNSFQSAKEVSEALEERLADSRAN